MVKILSIDDSRAVHAFITSIFDSVSSRVWHAFDGNQGVGMLEDNLNDKPELILLDWEMPGMSGIETLLKIRKKGIVIPVIMLTSKNSTEDIMQALSSGANEYVMKPFTRDILLEKIETVLDRKLV